MAYHWVVNKDSESPDYMKMIACFDDAGKEHCSIGPDQCWLEVPEGVAKGNAKVVEDEEAENGLILVDSLERAGPMWDALRAERNAKLLASDWTQLADSPLSGGDKTLWATYRQELRDLPDDTMDPEAVVWPEQP
jgi:Phage tail assembly chaperone protein